MIFNNQPKGRVMGLIFFPVDGRSTGDTRRFGVGDSGETWKIHERCKETWGKYLEEIKKDPVEIQKDGEDILSLRFSSDQIFGSLRVSQSSILKRINYQPAPCVPFTFKLISIYFQQICLMRMSSRFTIHSYEFNFITIQ
jgi:hypothetical protein